MPSPVKIITRYLENLRFPILLLVTVGLLLVNLVIPDALPFVDELLMALVATVLVKLKRKPKQVDGPDQDTAA
jgi:hypothetical protein